MELSNREIANIFKAFCDENRIHILKMLGDGEKCACSLLEDLRISQPTLSHHMKILCAAGMVTSRKEGKWIHYALRPEGVACAQACLHSFVSPENDN